jgi:hypothetical protein
MNRPRADDGMTFKPARAASSRVRLTSSLWHACAPLFASSQRAGKRRG